MDIPEETALTTSLNVYQRSDVTNNEQILFIERFSAELGGIYTCNTDLVVEGESIAISVFITDGELLEECLALKQRAELACKIFIQRSKVKSCHIYLPEGIHIEDLTQASCHAYSESARSAR